MALEGGVRNTNEGARRSSIQYAPAAGIMQGAAAP